MAAESDPDTAGAIMQSAGLTPYDVEKGDCYFCYDEFGSRYEVPLYALFEPRNLLQDSNGAPGSVPAVEAPASEAPARGSAPAHDQKQSEVVFKIRLSTNEPDIEVKAKAHSTILDLKKQMLAVKGYAVEAQRVILFGKLLPDALTLQQANVRDGPVLQFMIKKA